jgi:hypothetical protein
MTAKFNYRFNTGIESHLKWLQIIKVLKGVSSVEELRISEKIVIKLFLNIRKYKKRTPHLSFKVKILKKFKNNCDLYLVLIKIFYSFQIFVVFCRFFLLIHKLFDNFKN